MIRPRDPVPPHKAVVDPHEGEQAVAYALDPPSQCPDMSVKQCEPEKGTQSVLGFVFYVS